MHRKISIINIFIYIVTISFSEPCFFYPISSLKDGSGSRDSHTAQRVPISRSSFSLYQSSRQRLSLFHPFSSTWNSRFHASPIRNREFSSSKNNCVANIPASTYPPCSLRIDRLTIPLLPFFVLLSSLVAWSINIPDSPSLAILKETLPVYLRSPFWTLPIDRRDDSTTGIVTIFCKIHRLKGLLQTNWVILVLPFVLTLFLIGILHLREALRPPTLKSFLTPSSNGVCEYFLHLSSTGNDKWTVS